MRKSRVRAKVVGIPGGTPKIEEKNVHFQEGQCNKLENSRGFTVNLAGNPGVNFKGIDTQQGGYNFFLENSNSSYYNKMSSLKHIFQFLKSFSLIH